LRPAASPADYLGGLPAQIIYGGLLTAPVLIAGVVRLWRAPQLRYLAVTVTVVAVYVLAWVPGKPYYTSGLLPVVLAAGAVATERWFARGRRPRARLVLVVAAVLAGTAYALPSTLPIWPVRQLHQHTTSADLTDMVGWPPESVFELDEHPAITVATASNATTGVARRDR